MTAAADGRTVNVAAAALVDVAGRILMAQRPPGKSLAGLWEFPGGKIESGETPEAALVRELDEELGIQVAIADLVPLVVVHHDYPDFTLVMTVHACRKWSGTAHGREGQPLVWTLYDDLAALPMPPADLPVVAALDQFMRPAGHPL